MLTALIRPAMRWTLIALSACLMLWGSAQAATLNIDAGQNLTFTLAATENGALTGTGNTLAFSSTMTITRTGAGVGFPGASGTGDYVVAAIQSITVNATSTAQFTLITLTNPLPTFTIGTGIASVVVNSNVITAGKVITISSPTTVGANVTFDTTSGVPAGADVIFNSAVTASANQTLTVKCGTSNATFQALGTTGNPLGALKVSAGTVELFGDIQLDGGGNMDFTGVTVATNTHTNNFSIKTDTTGGTLIGGSVLFGAGSLDPTSGANFDLTIDTTAGAGGTPGAVVLPKCGLNVNYGNITVTAGALTLNGANTIDSQTYKSSTINVASGNLSSTTGGGRFVD